MGERPSGFSIARAEPHIVCVWHGCNYCELYIPAGVHATHPPFPPHPHSTMDATSSSNDTRQKRSPSGRSTMTARAATTRGATACAECRRLKIRCVGGWPCDSCVRRKCSSICPTGALQTSEQLHALHILAVLISLQPTMQSSKGMRFQISLPHFVQYLMVIEGQGRFLIASTQ